MWESCYNCCLLSCKDTNLKAIHNVLFDGHQSLRVVFYLAKILIWKQFTTSLGVEFKLYCCLLSCKDTNLKAIHNILTRTDKFYEVVFYLAKILIWKQFTTHNCINACGKSCLLSCKDTNLKAIHNRSIGSERGLWVVFYLAKILIWKQFTTTF